NHLDGCSDCRARVISVARELDSLGATSPSKESDAQPGDTIGRYRVTGVLGAGSMGTVYAGWDPTLQRKVALKLLPVARDGDDAERRLREAHALALVAHPNVVPVYDVGEHFGRLFMAMELVEGQ